MRYVDLLIRDILIDMYICKRYFNLKKTNFLFLVKKTENFSFSPNVEKLFMLPFKVLRISQIKC